MIARIRRNPILVVAIIVGIATIGIQVWAQFDKRPSSAPRKVQTIIKSVTSRPIDNKALAADYKAVLQGILDDRLLNISKVGLPSCLCSPRWLDRDGDIVYAPEEYYTIVSERMTEAKRRLEEVTAPPNEVLQDSLAGQIERLSIMITICDELVQTGRGMRREDIHIKLCSKVETWMYCARQAIEDLDDYLVGRRVEYDYGGH